MLEKAFISHDVKGALIAQNLAFCASMAVETTPDYIQQIVSNGLKPTGSIGIGTKTSLKASFWDSHIREREGSGDLSFFSVIMHGGGARAWRNKETTPGEAGGVEMQPFDVYRWRFDGPGRYVHLSVPFALLRSVSESIFDRDVMPEQIWIPMGMRDPRLCNAVRSISATMRVAPPTTLILDSWALLLSEIAVRGFSSHSRRYVCSSVGKIASRGIAAAIDYIEANIDADLSLSVLAEASAASVYHFAHGFKAEVGISPHAYVLSRRLRRAEAMLRNANTSLAHVAAACGFSSQSHFTTAFRRDLGVTPGEYRRIVSS